MKNTKIKIRAMVAGTLGMLGIALGAAAQSMLGAVAVVIGLLAVGVAAKTLVDTREMEREYSSR